MATGLDTNRIQSLVIFNEILPVYCLSDDIECRFYVDPSLDCSLDKIGLYRIGWTHKQDFVVIKDVHNCMTDEFDERKLVFPWDQLPNDVIKENTEYQFCYFHPFGDRKSYQLCGRSESFRFSKSASHPIENQRKASPSAPEVTINYPKLEMENIDINQTAPKTLFNSTDLDFDELFRSEDIYLNSTPKMNRKSNDFEIQIKSREIDELKERFVQQNRIKDLEIEKLKTTVRLSEEKVSSLEYELQTKLENEDRLELIHHDLMDTIRVSEAKNCSLEEQLHKRDNQIKHLSAQCQSNEKLIDELTEKLAISRSEIDLYQSTVDTIGPDLKNQDLRQENRLLKDKLQEVMDISENLKESNDRLIREKRVLDKNKLKIQTELEVMRQKFADLKIRSDKTEEDKLNITLKLRAKQSLIKQYANIIKESNQQSEQSLEEQEEDELNVTIHANEMAEEVKDYCIAQTTDALNKYSDIKSMADSIVYAMDEKFGNGWVCYIGQDFAHNSLLHVFGTYFAFGINDLKIIIYKVNDMPDFDQVIRWAKESPNVEILFKTEFCDNGFEESVVSTVLESINEEFSDYCELSAHITRIFDSNYGQKYGHNWFAICGESDRFDSNLLIFTKKYKYIELEINCLKVIVIQFDEKTVETTNTLYGFKSFANRIY